MSRTARQKNDNEDVEMISLERGEAVEAEID